MDEGDGMKYYVMLRMEGEFPGKVETLKWEIGENAYDKYLEIFDRSRYGVNTSVHGSVGARIGVHITGSSRPG